MAQVYNVSLDLNKRSYVVFDLSKRYQVTPPGSTFVVSSSINSSTNTTNALGPQHVVQIQANSIARLEEKKAEELRLANLKAEEEKRARWRKEE